MKTKIIISGQNNGNHTILLAIGGDGLTERKNGMFNSIILQYDSKKHATKALSEAYQVLVKNEPDQKGKLTGINYVRGNVLYYDASKATITTN